MIKRKMFEFFVNKKLIVNHPQTNYATTVRGIAAVSVVGIHAGMQRPFLDLFNLGPSTSGVGALNRIVELGGAGPAAFFISSGFVLSIVWEKSRHAGYLNFALRRYFRLTPLYFLVLIYLYILTEITLDDLLLRLLFLDAFIPDLFSRDPIGILWTLSVEFWCSLLVPLISISLKSRFKVAWLLFFLICSRAMPRILVFIGTDESMAWKSIPSALFCFAIGAYLSNLSNSPTSQEAFKILSVFSIGFLFMYLEGGYMGAWWVTTLLSTSYLGYRRTQVNQKINGPISLFLGTICYGIYLIHWLVLARVKELSETFAFYLTLPITVVIATFTWKYVERPTSNLIRKRDFLKRAPSGGNL